MARRLGRAVASNAKVFCVLKITLGTWIMPDYVTRRFNAFFSRTGFGRWATGNGFVARPNIDREIPYEKKASFAKRFL